MGEMVVREVRAAEMGGRKGDIKYAIIIGLQGVESFRYHQIPDTLLLF